MTLVAAIESDELRIYTDIASNFASAEFVYMLKSPDTVITADNFHSHVQTGSVLGEFIITTSNHAFRWLLGATVARLTPDQKVACSNHVGLRFFLSIHHMRRRKNFASLGGLEPPTFRLTAERANRLRHRDSTSKGRVNFEEPLDTLFTHFMLFQRT